MLSAVAARKAAQAGKTVIATQPPSSGSQNIDTLPNDSDSDSRHHRTLLRPDKSKRKSSEPANLDATVTRKKPRKKVVRTNATSSRYYESENRTEGTSNKMGSLSSGSDSDEDVGEVHFVGQDLTTIPRPQKIQRAWSPSNPPFDSSDNEQDYSTPGPSLHPYADVDAGYHSIQPLSLIPRPEKNVFYLDGLVPSFLLGRNGTIVALEENETMALLGVYSLTVLRGAISLLGTEISATTSKSYTIFAPKCSPIPVLTAISSGNHSSASLLPDIVDHAVSPTSTVLLLEDAFTGVEGLGRVCKTLENAFEASSFSDAVLKLSTAKLLTSLSRSLQPFRFPDSWRAAFSSVPLLSPNKPNEDDIQSPESLTSLVRGQKRTGKSTLSRTLVNRLLSHYRRVAFLECDVGQTEFTPPGLVSLQLVDRPIFGPPFTHPQLPYASHFIGANSPHNDPAYYVSAISALIQTYKLELQYPAPEDGAWDSDEDDDRISDFVPLVVNTMGWIKGLGADLARQIEEIVEPTQIFSTSLSSVDVTSLTKEPVSSFVGAGKAPRIFEVEAISSGPQASRYSAADWRTLSLMSYFHSVPSPVQYELLPGNLRPPSPITYDTRAPVCTWNCGLPLMSQEPFAVAPAEAIDSVILFGAGAEDVVPSEIARVLNGSLVALVSCQPGTLDAYDSNLRARPSMLPYVQGARPPDPSMSNCIGLALVRGVSPSLFDVSTESQQTSTDEDVLHLLTPVPPALIAVSEARCLVKGEIELPVWGMLDYRELERRGNRMSEFDSMPYLQWSKGGGIGAERRRVRRNIMRRGQM